MKGLSAAHHEEHIAVYLQDLDRSSGYVAAAAAHAEHHGSTLHLLYIVPEATEGTLITALHTGAPLGVETAIDMLSEITASLPAALKVQIHVWMGSESRELKAMLRESEAEPTINSFARGCCVCLSSDPRLRWWGIRGTWRRRWRF